ARRVTLGERDVTLTLQLPALGAVTGAVNAAVTLALRAHGDPAPERERVHTHDGRARERGHVLHPAVLAAHDGDARHLHRDALGDDDVDSAHDGNRRDVDHRSLDLGLPQVDHAAAHDRERGDLALGAPTALALATTHD